VQLVDVLRRGSHWMKHAARMLGAVYIQLRGIAVAEALEQSGRAEWPNHSSDHLLGEVVDPFLRALAQVGALPRSRAIDDGEGLHGVLRRSPAHADAKQRNQLGARVVLSPRCSKLGRRGARQLEAN